MNQPQPSLPPGLKARIMADAKAVPAVEKGAFWKRLVGAWALLIIFLGGMLMMKGTRPDFQQLPNLYRLGASIASAFAGLALFVLSSGRGKDMSGPPRGALIAGALIAPSALALWVMSVVGHGSLSVVPANILMSLKHSMRCDMMAMMLGMPLLLAFSNIKRGLVSPAPRVLGACMGAAAAAWAHFVLHLVCPVADNVHAVVGHVGPVIPLAIVGALLGPRWFNGPVKKTAS